MTEKTLKRALSTNSLLLILPLMVLLLSFAILSCDNDDESGLMVGIVYDAEGKGDKSFNDSAYEGIRKAQEELGAVVIEETTDGTEPNREELLRSLATENDLVIAVGFSFENSIKRVASLNPDTNFAGVDIQQGDDPPANFASLLFNEAEGSFLVGAAAALTTETDKVGFIGGVCSTPDKLIEKFEAGFIAGAKTVNPNITVETEYLSDWDNLAGFSDVAGGRRVALRMFGEDADVVFHAAGGSGAGLFEAAEEFSETGGTKAWAIGVDSDQYQTAGESVREYILTSMLKRVDVAVYNIIEAQKNGEFSGGPVDDNLSNGGVGYSTSGGFVDDIKDQLEDYKARIISGEINVPTAPEKGCGMPQTY